MYDLSHQSSPYPLHQKHPTQRSDLPILRPKLIHLFTSLIAITLALLFETATVAQSTQSTDISSKSGAIWEFQEEGGDFKPIQVPAGGWRAQGYKCDAGTYRATIQIPANAKGKQIRLAFAAVNFGATVKVGPDSTHLTEVANHINGWMPFHADITRYAKPGEKLLVVVEVKGRKKFMANGKYTVPEAASWCPTLEEGILRGVSLELLPPVHLENAFIRTKTGPDILHPEITVTNSSDRPADIRLVARVSRYIPSTTGRGKPATNEQVRYPTIPDTILSLAPGETRSLDLGEIPWKAGAASYWWPNLPYRPGYRAKLHLLEASIIQNGKTVHTLQTRFGFRDFKVVGNHYELNGVRCNLRGDNQQEADFGTDAYGVKAGFGPPTANNPGWPKAVDNLLRLNFNVMRIHQVPATPYMLDVCDELGLMIVDESPLRGSEGQEDYVHGRDNMLNMDRELVLRDRNHPSIVIWSAANEWTEPIRDCIQVITALDNSRPIIADGVGDMGNDVINMQHYVNGLGGLPVTGGTPRTDRPYGETEAVWDMDNTWQGFAWMATSVRLRRLKGNADLRNYVLNNAWSNYVPGESAETEILEKKVKNMGGNKEIRPAILDPWNHPIIQLMQQCYHPLAACDMDFDRLNARSNENGDWPTVKPRLPKDTHVTRRIAVFNDEFNGASVTLHWEIHSGSKAGAKLDGGTIPLAISPGEFRMQEITFTTPKNPGTLALVLSTAKGGQERFREEKMVFEIVDALQNLLPDGDYRLINVHSRLPAVPTDDKPGSPVVQQNATDGSDIWHLTNLGTDLVQLVNKKTGHALAIAKNASADGASILQMTMSDGANREATQIWQLASDDGNVFTLTNRASGKLLDDFARATSPGSKLVQWESNGGDNQQWQLKPVK